MPNFKTEGSCFKVAEDDAWIGLPGFVAISNILAH